MDNKKYPVKDIVEDPNVVIRVAEDSVTLSGIEGYNLVNNFTSSPLNAGYNYMVVKVGKKLGNDAYIALPLSNMPYEELSKVDNGLFHNIRHSIEAAVNVYIKNGKDLSTTEQSLFNRCKDLINVDLTSPEGILKYLEGFLYNDKRDFGERSQFKFDDGNLVFRRKKPIKGQATQFFVGKNVKDRDKSLQIFSDNIESMLKAQYFNTSRVFTSDNTNIPIVNSSNEVEAISYMDIVKTATKTNIIGKEVDTNSDGTKAYSYTVQKVIRFDTSFVEPKPTGTDYTTTETINDIIESSDIEYEELEPMEFNFVDDGLSFAVAEDEIGKLDKSLEGILVKDLGFAKQEDIVSYISEKMLSKLYTDGTINVKATTDEIKDTFTKNNATVDFNIKKIKSNILKATQSKKAEDVAKFKEQLANLERFKKLVESVVGNWNTLVGISLNKVNRLNGTKFIDNQDDDTVFENDLFEIEGDENANWAVSDLTTDRKKSLSRDVKLFCSGIVDLNSEGKPNKTWIGTSRLVPFDIVYNTVQALTSNLPPNLDAIKNELSKSTDAFPWLNDFISKLDNANSRTKKSVVKALTNYYANTTSYKYSTDSRGNYFVRAFDSDASAMGKVILNTWESNFMKSGLVGYADGTTINEDAANKWLERYRELNKTKGINVTIEDVDSLLKEVGIVLSPQALNDIKTNGITVTKSKNISLRNIMSNGFSPIVVIRNFLELNKGKDLSTKLTTETAIERIAKIQNKFETKLHSNSQKSGGRTIYSYGKPKFFVNRFRRFKDYVEGNDVTMGKVLESPFVTNLLWATNLKNSTTRDSFMANFDYEIADLEPISELGKKSRKNRELNNVSPAEVELYRLFGLMAKRPDKSGNRNRVISLMHPTTSDKTTVHNIITIAAPFSYNTDGTLDDKSYKLLYDNLILPEITRIRHFEALKAKGVDITKFEGWTDGWNKFLVIPEMNSYPEVFIGESLNPNLENEYENIITNVLKPHVESLVSEKKILWDEYEIGLNVTNDKGKIIESNKYLDKQYLSSLEARFAKNPRVAAMYDMVGQYLIGNANTWGLFNTDPAQYFDKKALAAWNNGNKDLAVQKVYENMGKRLAADVAPGEESVANDSGTITYAFIKDPKVTSLRFEQLKEQFGDSIASSYEGMDGTDAQEFVTLQEHLFNMDADGLLPDGMYDVIANTIQQELSKVDIAGNPTPNHYYTEAIVKNLNAINPQLGDEYEKIVLQVKKPVYVENVFDDDLGVERRIYVKSSAYPLTPELCAKIQMDDIRIAMEKQGIQRLAFATATKVGNYKKNVELFDSEGNVVPNIDFSTTKMVVPRSGLRDQMPVPYDEMKKEIKKVSQASKNLFVNIKEVPGMAALEQEYLNIYHEIFKEQYDKLISDVVVDGNLNVPKLKDILIEEATGRGYPLSDIQMLELDTNLRLLPFSPNAAKYESLLNSIVENRVDKIMLPGKSFVLSTEMGYKVKPTAKLVGNAKNIERLKNRGLVTTRNFTGELLPQRLEDGVVKPAQVIMPFKFRDNNGNLLHIEDFMDGNFIDTNKLPESVLKLFGMRIPNQGPNSQSAIEIVGFMPHNAGDVIVATKDYLAQMGSDFDVDKLYAYMYETEYKNGRIIKKDSLKNKIVDIHLQIHANPDPRVQRQIAKPIGEWKLKSIADEVTKLKSKGKELFSPASDGYQKMKFLNATAGKSGVGTYSVASMFVANMQGKGMVYTTLDKDDKKVPIQLAIGNTIWNGDISNIYTLRSQELIENAGGYDNLTEEEKKQITYKSEVVEGHQSVAVDNEKLQLMDKTNDNAFTFNYTIAAMSAGFEDELVWLRSQPIIFDYVKELQYLKSPLSGFFGDAEAEASSKVLSKYGVKIDPETLNADSTTYLTIDNMKKCIEGTSESFTVTQGVALGMFQLLHEVGMKIQSVTSATNTDSKGIGINMFVNYAKQQAVQNLINSPIKNAEKLLGIFNEEGILVEPTTIAGFATKYGLETANNLWSGLFPYQNMTVQEMFNTIEGLTKSEEAGFTSKANTQQEVWTDFKSYLFSRDDLGIINSTVDINAERDRLFIDRKDKKGNVLKKSFISKMAEIAELPEMKRRPFINRLNFTIEYDTNKASRVSFNAASAENLEESQIYQDIIDLLVNDRPIPNSDITTRAMMEDLIKTQYLGGGIQEAIQFIKYIPAQYYYLIPFADRLSNVWSELNDSNNRWLNFKSDSLPNFIEQWIQHNPNKVTDVKPELVKSIKDGKFVILDKNLLTIQSDNTMTSEPYVKRYNKDAKGNKTELFKFINIFDENGNPVYQQIPLLGTFGMSEYNANIPQGMLQTSLLSPIGVTKVESGSNVDNSNTTDEAITNPLSTTNQVLTQAVNLGISNKPVNINDVLVKMSATTSNPYLQLLSEELIKIKNNSTIRIDNSINTFGKYSNNEISINTNLIKTLPKLGEVIIHESLHSIGDTQINQFLQDKSKLNPQVREAITSLETLRNKLIQSVKDTPKYKEYLTKRSKVGTEERVVFTPEEVAQFESTSSLKEFFSYAMSNENTQKWLNSIEYKANQTALDRFKEILNKMYHALIGRGITIKPNSALSTAIKNSIVILNAQELYESDVTITQITKLFNQYGIDYKFTLKGGIVINAEYKQQNKQEYEKLNEKKWNNKYNELLNIENIQFKGEGKSNELNEYELFTGIFANEGQKNAINELRNFINSDKEVFTLIGRAGTGKTTILNKVLSGVSKSIKVGGAAVSHKAKKVLGKSIGNDKVSTLASMLAIKLDESTGKFTPDEFAREQGKVPIKKYDLIIIDEASMISKEMYKEIINMKNPTAKVIFVGDNAQLQPIGSEEDSPVFNINDKAKLTEITRQAKNSPILNVTSKIAQNIESKTPILRVLSDKDRVNFYDFTTNSSLIFTDNEEKAIDNIVNDIKNSQGDVNYVKAVTFNNEVHNNPQSVKNLNIKIRNKLWGKQSKNQFNIGEILTAYDGYRRDIGADVDEQPIFNSEDYTVSGIENIKNSNHTISVQSKKQGIRTFTYNYDIVMVSLKDSEGNAIIGYSVPVIAETSKEQFEKDLKHLWNTDKQLAFKLKEQFANLHYGYAITSHKAQGSTYKNVYVFEDNILGKSNASSVVNKNKSLYVATSRASNKLVMISINNKKSDDTIDTKSRFTLDPTELVGETIDSLAVYEDEPYNSLPSKKDIYNQFQMWDNKLNRPKTWSMNVDRNALVKIAQNINKFNKVYTAKIEQQPFLDKGKYLNKQYIQLTIKPEMNDLNNRLNIILDDNEKMEELMKTCKY